MGDRDKELLAQQIFNILSDVYLESPWSVQQINQDLQRSEVDYFFVYEQKEMVGFLSLQQLVGELEITNIAVLHKSQRKGFGRQLLAFLDDCVLPIFLEVRESNQTAQHLYQQFGFKTVGKRKDYYHQPTEDAILMKREGKS